MLGTILVIIPIIAASADVENEADMRCGAYCLYISLKGLGLRVSSYAEIEAKLGAPSSAGYSLGQIADVAEQYGAKTLGVVTAPENLLRRERPFMCIARVRKNHFVNIGAIDRGRATIVDPPKKYELPLDTLRADWDGTALLLSTGPLRAEEELSARGSSVAAAVTAIAIAVGVLVAAVFTYRRKYGDPS